jgi:hypothetical protein
LTIRLGQGARLETVTARPNVLEVILGPAGSQGEIPVHMRVKKDIPYGPLRGEVSFQESPGTKSAVLTVPFGSYATEGQQP